MSQQRYNRIQSFLVPNSIIEIEGGAGESPVICSWSLAKVILAQIGVSPTNSTELVHQVKVQQLSNMIQTHSSDATSIVSLDLCRPLQPKEPTEFRNGQVVQILMDNMWFDGSISAISREGKHKLYDVLVESIGTKFTVKRSDLRQIKIWNSNSQWEE